MLAGRCERAYRVRPCEHCAAVTVHGVRESALPYEFPVVCVDHREISVEAVDGVADEGARFGSEVSVKVVRWVKSFVRRLMVSGAVAAFADPASQEVYAYRGSGWERPLEQSRAWRSEHARALRAILADYYIGVTLHQWCYTCGHIRAF